MSKFKEVILYDITLGKLVHGGQALAKAPDGRMLLVWGGLPREEVDIRVTKSRKDYLEGVVSKILLSSKDRIEPLEPNSYLSTSPWQIMKFELENKAKQGILEETFDRAGLKGLSFKSFVFGEQQFGYRNKMEIGFWGDENGIHLAHYIRATHGKQIVVGSKLANNNINNASADFIKQINKLSQTVPLRAGDLKTVVFRCSRAGAVVSALFIKKDIDFSSFELPNSLKGLVVYYSNPKSLASIPTKKLYSFGDIKISDTVMDNNITYDVMSFFQVNVSVFEKALEQMKNFKKELPSIDMYSGVGTIGIVLGSSELVESEESNVIMAKLNAKGSLSKVVHLNSEEALDYVTKDKILILDPPRAGLHKKIIDRIAEVQPAQIMYLSCNPSTQARDVKLLEDYYKITHAQGFNFFPRTPHIESLVILERK